MNAGHSQIPFPMCFADDVDWNAVTAHIDRLFDFSPKIGLDPTVCCVFTDHKKVGFLGQSAGFRVFLGNGCLTLFAFSECERAGKTESVTVENDFRGWVAKGQCRCLEYFAKFKIVGCQAGQCIVQIGAFVFVNHTICKGFFQSSNKGCDQRVGCNGLVSGKPLVQEMNFFVTEVAINQQAPGKADQFSDLTIVQPSLVIDIEHFCLSLIRCHEMPISLPVVVPYFNDCAKDAA